VRLGVELAAAGSDGDFDFDPLDDTNNRLVLTAIGAGAGYSTEVVQALVLRNSVATLPAAITLLGPTPVFSGGTSTTKLLTGDDTVTDIDATILPLWKDCSYILSLAVAAKAAADLVGDSSTPVTELGSPGSPKNVYIDDDYQLTAVVSGAGTIVYCTVHSGNSEGQPFNIVQFRQR